MALCAVVFAVVDVSVVVAHISEKAAEASPETPPPVLTDNYRIHQQSQQSLTITAPDRISHVSPSGSSLFLIYYNIPPFSY